MVVHPLFDGTGPRCGILHRPRGHDALEEVNERVPI
jgi:hypothetical protein